MSNQQSTNYGRNKIFQFQQTLIDTILFIAIFLIPAAMIAVSIRHFSRYGEITFTYIIHIVTLSIPFTIAIFRHRLPHTIKFYTLLLLFVTVFLTGIFEWGILGSNTIIILSMAILTALCGYKRLSFITLILSIIIILFVGYLAVNQHLFQELDVVRHFKSYTPWIIIALNILFWGTIIIFTVTKLFQQLQEILDQNHQNLKNLERYQFFFNTPNEAIFIHNAETGAIQEVNHTTLKMFQYTQEEILNCTVADLTAIDQHYNQEIAIGKIKNALNGIPQIFKWHSRRKDGTTFWSEVSLKLINFNDTPQIIAVVRDRTDKEQLLQEHFKLQKLQSLGTLAGGIAHDFNNLLMGLSATLNRVSSKLNDEKLATMLKQGVDEIIRAKHLTQQLLTFSRGGVPVRENASIIELIKDSADFILSGSNIRPKYSFPQKLAPLFIDREQISRVIQNLLTNSKEAMSGGGIIEISGENFFKTDQETLPLPNGRYLRLTISDQGKGIPRDQLERVFDPYFSTKTTSSGLGLSIVLSIITRHGGYITLDSIQSGTTVNLYLPATRSEEQITPEKSTQTTPESKPSTPPHILIIDDEEIILEMLQDLLEDEGYLITTSVSSSKGLELYRERLNGDTPVTCVVTDLTLPGDLSGGETIKQLLEISPDLPVIASSGYAHDPIIADYQQYGCAGALVKPYPLHQLLELLKTIL